MLVSKTPCEPRVWVFLLESCWPGPPLPPTLVALLCLSPAPQEESLGHKESPTTPPTLYFFMLDLKGAWDHVRGLTLPIASFFCEETKKEPESEVGPDESPGSLCMDRSLRILGLRGKDGTKSCCD